LCLSNVNSEAATHQGTSKQQFSIFQLIFNAGVFFLPEDGTFEAETHLKNSHLIFVLIKTVNLFGIL